MRQPFALAGFTLSGLAVFSVLSKASQSFETAAQVQQDDHVSLLQTKALMLVPNPPGAFTHKAGLVQTFSMSRGSTNEQFANAASGHLSQPAKQNDLPVPEGWMHVDSDGTHGAAGMMQTFSDSKDVSSEQFVDAVPGRLNQPAELNDLPLPAGWSNLVVDVEPQQQPQQTQQPQQPQQPQQAEVKSNTEQKGLAETPGWLQDMMSQSASVDRGPAQTAATAVSVEPPPPTAPPPAVASMPDWLQEVADRHGRPSTAEAGTAAPAGTAPRAREQQQSQDGQHRPQRQQQRSELSRPPQGGSSVRSTEPLPVSDASSAPYSPSQISSQKASLPPIGFVKTHKTGGSSIASILHRVGDARNLTFFLPAGRHKNALGWPGEFPGMDAEISNGAPRHQYDIICNHAVYQGTKMRAYLNPDPFFFTVLRDPIEQSKSAFDYFFPPCGETWDDRLAWLGDVETGKETLSRYKRGQSLRAQFQNPQAHDLGWYEHSGSNAFDRDDAKIDEWLAIIDRSFGLVMLTEHFDEGLILLRRQIGLELDDLKYVHMKSSKKTHGELTEEQRAHLQDLLHVDVRLYNHFAGKFWDKWNAAGSSAELNEDVGSLRAKSAQLAEACSDNNDSLCPWFYRTDSDEYTKLLKNKQSAMTDAARVP